MDCFCCWGPYALVSIIIIILPFQIISYVTGLCFGNKRPMIRKALNSINFGVLALLISAFLYLSVSPISRKIAFAKMYSYVSKDLKALDGVRCDLLKTLSGKVLEIGPGPGTNFKCLNENKAITKWVGIEPNEYFNETLHEASKTHQLAFPIEVVFMGAENLEFQNETFDAIFGTHVLCSVTDSYQVLKEISRVLKKEGSFYFLEHVQSPDSSSFSYFLQHIFQSFFMVIGNGCQFRPLWKEISDSNLHSPFYSPPSSSHTINHSLPPFFEISLKHFNANISIPMIQPHIIGSVTKH